MTDSPEETDTGAAAPRRRAPFWIAVAGLAAIGGGGAFYAMQSGLTQTEVATALPEPGDAPAPRFVELDPALVAVGGPGTIRQLRFRAFLEVSREGADHVPDLRPRILDVCASYLRALDLDTLEDPRALMRIRAQLLRRVRLLAGPEAVTDMLIVDFVIT